MEKKAKRNKAVTAVYLILRKGEDILLSRRCNTGFQDGNYQVPAGHIDADELPTQALIREMQEEIGVIIKKEDLKLLHASFRPKYDESGDRVDYYFGAKTWAGEIRNTEPHKCDDLGWFNIHSLPENLTPHVRVAIEAAEKGEPFSELGLDFIKSSGMYIVTEE